MINSAAFFILMVFMFGLIECHRNKTICIGRLDSTKSEEQLTGLGYKLAYDVARNSSNFTDFFEEYEIKFDQAFITYENEGNAIVFADVLLNDRGKNVSTSFPLIILGPHTPEDSTPVLQLTAYYRKLMVTYLATPSKMKEPSTFGYGFTFEPQPIAFNGAKVEILKYFGWKRVAIVYDFLTGEGRYMKVVENLATNRPAGDSLSLIAIEPINVLLGTKGGAFHLHDDIKESLRKLKEKDAKIFLGEFDVVGATLVFCELYKLKMYGREYVWILNPDAGTVEDWVKQADREISKGNKNVCKMEQYREVVNSTILLGDGDLRKDVNTTTDSGLTSKEFFNKKQLANYTADEKSIIATAFDVMWAVMLALKGASKKFAIEKNSKTAKGDKPLTEALLNMLKSSNFEGLTGPVSFDKSGLRQGITLLRQYQDEGKKLVTVGQYPAKANKSLDLFNGATKYSLWPAGRIPLDRTVKEEEAADIHPALFITFSIAASLGIFLGLIFLGFNRYYRKYKFIRLSAPVFNDVMVLGCIMCLSTVFLFGLRKFESPKETMPRICKARAWILDIGFSLAFGAMFIKTWRIYKICTNKRLKVRLGPLSDWTLLAMVGGIVLVDVVTLVAWEVTDPLEHKQVNISEKRDPDDYKIIVDTLNTCMAVNLPMWLALIYVYKGILLLYGLFLAYETRNVLYAHLNDSRVIGICVYNVVVLSVIGAFLSVILVDKQFSELYAALSVCIIFPATATICLIFIPKLVHRLKMESLDDESGDTTMTNTMARPSIDFTSTYQGTELGRERSVNGSYTNTLCVEQNGQPMGTLSTATSPTPTTSLKELSPNTLED